MEKQAENCLTQTRGAPANTRCEGGLMTTGKRLMWNGGPLIHHGIVTVIWTDEGVETRRRAPCTAIEMMNGLGSHLGGLACTE